MYDTLIDELRQDAGGNPEETISLAEKAVETVVSGDEAEADASAAVQQAAADGNSVDGDEQQENDSSAATADEVESWSDDPVRMYLTQMGEIPLLTRKKRLR